MIICSDCKDRVYANSDGQLRHDCKSNNNLGMIVPMTTMKGMKSMLDSSVTPEVTFNEDSSVMFLQVIGKQQEVLKNVSALLGKMIEMAEQ